MTRDEYELYGRRILQAKGNDMPNAKLNPDVVREIRTNRHGLTAKQWADKLDVHYRTIEKVRYGEGWGHVQ